MRDFYPQILYFFGKFSDNKKLLRQAKIYGWGQLHFLPLATTSLPRYHWGSLIIFLLYNADCTDLTSANDSTDCVSMAKTSRCFP